MSVPLPPPQPRLDLGSHCAQQYHPGRRRLVAEHQHRAGLSFCYAGQRIHGRHTQTALPQRQLHLEQTCRERLQTLGFRVALRQSQALPKDSAEMFELPGPKAWLHFVQHQLPQLRAEGWQIVVHPGFEYHLLPVDEWRAQLKDTGEAHWVDLALYIRSGQRDIPLIPLLLPVLRQHPELLASIPPSGEWLRLPLQPTDKQAPQGLLVPLAKLHQILQPLAEACHQAPPGSQVLRLARADAVRLPLLDDLLHWPTTHPLLAAARRLCHPGRYPSPPPQSLNACLRPYQQEGLSWLQGLSQLGGGGILADDMGLGKTLQVLSHLLLEKQQNRLQHPALIVLPTSLIHTWQNEAARFTPGLRVLALQGSERQAAFALRDQYDLLLTTYSLLGRDLRHWKGYSLQWLILDEAHHIKNPSSQIAQAANQLQAKQRLCLSGTPLENHLGELWALFQFLYPDWLGDARSFRQRYRQPIERLGDDTCLQQLQQRIRPFLLRRCKETVATELPPKNEITKWVELSDEQRHLYEQVRHTMSQQLVGEPAPLGRPPLVLEALLQLRQVCCDSRLLQADTPHTADITPASAKLKVLLEMLECLLAEGRRILVFSQFSRMLGFIARALETRGIAYAKLTGQTQDRQTPVEAFQSGQLPVFLISLKAGGCGLTLTAADTVIHYDPWWNPAAEQQATDRAYRLGQDKPVFVYRLITRHTVEERIQQLQQSKSSLAQALLENAPDTAARSLPSEELARLLAPLPQPCKTRDSTARA